MNTSSILCAERHDRESFAQRVSKNSCCDLTRARDKAHAQQHILARDRANTPHDS